MCPEATDEDYYSAIYAAMEAGMPEAQLQQMPKYFRLLATKGLGRKRSKPPTNHQEAREYSTR